MRVNINRQGLSEVASFIAFVEPVETTMDAYRRDTNPFTVERAFDSARERQ